MSAPEITKIAAYVSFKNAMISKTHNRLQRGYIMDCIVGIEEMKVGESKKYIFLFLPYLQTLTHFQHRCSSHAIILGYITFYSFISLYTATYYADSTMTA
jgi:hypothetical protein